MTRPHPLPVLLCECCLLATLTLLLQPAPVVQGQQQPQAATLTVATLNYPSVPWM